MRRSIVRTLVLALILVAALGVPGGAQAQSMKVGVVDVEYIIHTSKKGKAAKAKLKKMFEDRQKTLDDAQKKLLDQKKKIEETSAMASQEKKKQMVMEYQQGLVSLQEMFGKNQQELAKKEVELMKPILKSLEEALTKLAADERYDLIMNRSEHGVLFAKDSLDITEKVLTKLDAG
jgi:outer membrane protein